MENSREEFDNGWQEQADLLDWFSDPEEHDFERWVSAGSPGSAFEAGAAACRRAVNEYEPPEPDYMTVTPSERAELEYLNRWKR